MSPFTPTGLLVLTVSVTTIEGLPGNGEARGEAWHACRGSSKAATEAGDVASAALCWRGRSHSHRRVVGGVEGRG